MDKHESVSQKSRRIVDGMVAAYTRRFQRIADLETRERGDVPGWVLVTVMTAGLVTALWLIADDQLSAILHRALDSVTNR
jgi:hypothetical protein